MGDSASASAVQAPRVSTRRIASLDDLRSITVLLVLLHHAVVAHAVTGHFDASHYLRSSAPIIDSNRWLGADLIYLATDVYFMPLLFLLSGLFVWPGLQRHGAARYLRGRLLRLGVPLVLGLILLMPPTYYPSYRLAGGGDGLLAYWWDTLRDGPLPNGPLWFIGVLLLFDAGAAALYRAGLDWGRVPARLVARYASRPALVFAALLTVSLAAYLPALERFGPLRWFALGPVLVQASRVGLYAVHFGAGIALGRAGGPWLSEFGTLARSWRRWAVLAALLNATFVAWTLTRHLATAPDWPILSGVLSCAACCAMEFACLSAALRLASRRRTAFTSLNASAYGIYLLHYPPLVWLQWLLLPAALPAALKCALVAAVTLAASWAATAAARRSRMMRAIL